MNGDVVIDTSKFEFALMKMQGKDFDRATRKGLFDGAKMLQNATRTTLSSKVRGTHRKKFPTWKTMQSGVRISKKDPSDVKVHIMGEFRLRFFEIGVTGRYWKKVNKKKGGHKYTGPITATHFFETAQRQVSQRIFNSMDNNIANAINKASS